MLDFLQGGGAPAGPDGMKLIEDSGCLGCHSTDGSKQVGPTFKGVFGRPVTVEKDGVETSTTSDRDYLKRAIVNPEAEIVKGYPPAMPAYDWMSEDEVEAVIDALETLK
ncbi:MAG: cytochrome c [Desulfuromonadales bacterium]|nr:cytochrome c [Desulfuromonadales bacterium]NIS44195.1 cytochrome c [Desulfuromonadales bacterium]